MSQVQVLEALPAITQDHIGSDAKSQNLQKNYAKKFHIPWKNVRDAVEQGYIYPGWKFIDYMRATDKGNPNLGLHCGTCSRNIYDREVFDKHISETNHTPKVRKPFEYVDVWGVQGASKSAFCFQVLAMLYQDWQTAVDRMILEKDMLIAAYEEVPEPEQRIPAGVLDDLNTIISKQEWFVDKDFYILFHRFLNTIRTKFGTILSTLPNVEFTPEMLSSIITFECILYPNSKYKVERYCWDIHPWEPAKAKFTKIVVEYSGFDIYRTPEQWWNKYQQKRMQVANELFTKMKDYMVNGGKQADLKKKVLSSLEKEDIPINELTKAGRQFGIKGDQENFVKYAKWLKERRSERASIALKE